MKQEIESIDKILIHCPNWVGDVVMASPVYEAFRINFPAAEIYACIRDYASGILAGNNWFDQVIAGEDKSLGDMFKLAGKIRAHAPDISVLLPNSTRSFLISKLAGIERVYGYKRNLRKHFLSGGPEPVYENGRIKPVPMQDYYLEICRWLELDVPANPKPKLSTTPELENWKDSLFEKYGIGDDDLLVGLNPGAKFGSSKCWPPEYFAQLADMLASQLGCKLVLLVGPGEEHLAQKIVAGSSAEIIDTSYDNVDLARLKAVVKACDLLVTNDTGPRHYAAALGCPAVVIMGPTDPVYTNSNLEKSVIIREELECSPCHLKVCPLNHECMVKIEPGRIFAAAKKLLNEGKQL